MKNAGSKVKQNGFTLIEVIIGFVLILLLTIVGYSIFANTTKLEIKNEVLTEAFSLAQNQIEAVKASAKKNDDFNNLKSTVGYVITSNPSYVYNIVVEELNSQLKKVRVNIYFRNMKAAQPQPDTSKSKSGFITSVGTLVIKP